MTRAELKQYRALQKEIDSLDKDIDKLNKQLGTVPTVAGKVQASEKDWPYIERHVTVEMAEPKLEDSIQRRIIIRQHRLEKAEETALEIERFISRIEDSTDRQIFQLAFIDGKTQEEIADIVSLEQSTVSKRISALVDE